MTFILLLIYQTEPILDVHDTNTTVDKNQTSLVFENMRKNNQIY